MAIAFDTFTSGTIVNPGTSQTFAHTCTGSNLILFVAIQNGGSHTNNITGVTYNSVALSKITSQDASAVSGLNQQWDLWYLINPATGSNNVVISAANSAVINGIAISYTGAKQSGVPDAGPVTNILSTGANNTNTVTSIADNCWHLVVGGDSNGASTAGTNATLRGKAGSGDCIAYDNNGAITPAGSHSETINMSGSASITIGITFAPFTSGGASSNLSLLKTG